MGNVLKGLFGGGDKPEAPKPAPVATGAAAPGAVAPGTSPDDFRRQENAFYQQMLAGMGQGQTGNELPEGIRQKIEQQAALLKEGGRMETMGPIFGDLMSGGSSGIPGIGGPFGMGGMFSGKSSGGGMPAMIPGPIPLPQSLLGMIFNLSDKDKNQGDSGRMV